MPDQRDEFDTPDRAMWAKRYKGLSIVQDRHEVDLKEQHDALEELRKLDLKRQAEQASILEAFAAQREELAVLQAAVAEQAEKYRKLTDHLKKRFAELKDEFKMDRSKT